MAADHDGGADRPEPVDDLVETEHSIGVAGGELRYTASTGRIVLREEVVTDGAFTGVKARAEVFVTAYTVPDAGPDRPVTFAFNGGPGSASLWLHLGLLGPRRVLCGDVTDPAPPPYRLADNAQTLLAHSDLVFIDPVSTGYSRAAEGQKPGTYHGFSGDVESVAEVIRLWTTRNQRWLSPKFLAGESYGTLRAAALAARLQDRYGFYLNGIMLISSVLDLGSVDFTAGNEAPYINYLPTYAAIAHYHGRHGDRPLDEVRAEAEAYAERDYPWALRRGHRLSTAERAAAVATVARLTGLAEDYVDAVDLRVEHIRFFTQLLRDERKVVGRLDGRATGPDPEYGRERMADDVSYSAVHGAFAAGLNHYVRAELGYANDLPYETISEKVRPWSYKEFEGAPVTAADRLAAAMRANPFLKVHVAFGLYDGSTPYYAAEDVLAHLAVPTHLLANISRAYYPTGHMTYLHEPSRLRQSADLAEFVRTSSGPAER
jgi:carboxypeptidase C (cathepsin A)